MSWFLYFQSSFLCRALELCCVNELCSVDRSLLSLLSSAVLIELCCAVCCVDQTHGNVM